jgi:diguanylate cyclase (GGDEF)-like protein
MPRVRRPVQTVVFCGDPAACSDGFSETLGKHGYRLRLCDRADDARRIVSDDPPEVLILDLDVRPEEMLTLCRTLKEDPLTYTQPIILCVSAPKARVELDAADAGSDDFVYKPLDPGFLTARVKMMVNRSRRFQTSNPLTGLPGGPSIEARMEELLMRRVPLAVGYCDVDNFKTFNDTYGYSRGDNVIRLTAMIIKEAVKHFCTKDYFYGHIGGDDFIFMVDHHAVEDVCRYIIDSFDKLIPFQYNKQDQARGYITARDRKNDEVKYPFLTISIGVVTNRRRTLISPLQVADLCAEMKRLSKADPGSNYLVDRRKK